MKPSTKKLISNFAKARRKYGAELSNRPSKGMDGYSSRQIHAMHLKKLKRNNPKRNFFS